MIKKLIILLNIFMTHLAFATESSLSQSSIRVLIVGAGPCGLCVAKALQNKGIYPDIIEKENQIRSDGAGIAIPANGSWALDKLGINIASKALLIHKMQFTDDQGELLIQEEIDSIHPGGAQFYSLGRDELMKYLLSFLDKTQIQTSTIIKNFSEENDQVKIELSDGQIRYYDLVIGCDGVHSSLRNKIHPNEAPEFLGLLVWRTVIDAPEDIEMPTYMLGADRLILLYPMLDNKTYVYGHLFQPVKSLPPDTFSNIFSSFGGLVPEVLDKIDQVKFHIYPMEKSNSVRFKLDGFERILLIGDAAHAFGPMLQNGAAQAFEDAYVLQELFDGIKVEQIPSFIDTFEKRRLPRVQSIYTMSNVKIQAISDPQQIKGRNEAIRKSGAPNVNGFKLIMQYNP